MSLQGPGRPAPDDGSGPATFRKLRAQYPRFIYRGCSVRREGSDVTFGCDFSIEPDIHFTPSVTVHGVPEERIAAIPPKVLENLAFHLGLMEIPSYWKCTCSPDIAIEAGYLEARQAAWWKKLLLRGQGEFFYTNQINLTLPDLVRLEAGAPAALAHLPASVPTADWTLVPVGGGKDSAVTLGLLRQAGRPFRCFALNPSKASRALMELAGGEPPILASRAIDPTLLELNARGFLNGHTPFSAYLAFLTVACGVLFGARWVALSNERSANEGNVSYLGTTVNHQYSKTFEFEQGFRDYCATYLTPDVEYFSFLRPLYELQISRLLSGLDSRLTEVIRSCNRGQKTDTWCEACAKCLFVYATLYPFLSGELRGRIFRTDIFRNEQLSDDALSLVTQSWVKPFDCVGTREEAIVAFHLCVGKVRQAGGELPPILQLVMDRVLRHEQNLDARAGALLRAWNGENALPPQFEAILRQAVFA